MIILFIYLLLIQRNKLIMQRLTTLIITLCLLQVSLLLCKMIHYNYSMINKIKNNKTIKNIRNIRNIRNNKNIRNIRNITNTSTMNLTRFQFQPKITLPIVIPAGPHDFHHIYNIALMLF